MVAVLAAMSGLGGSGGPAAAQGGAAVTIVDNAYQPSAVSVPVGARVTWTNSGAAVHTATAQSGAFDSGILNPGQSFSFTASAPGTIPFFCRVHPDVMMGTITVTAAATAPAAASQPAPAAASQQTAPQPAAAPVVAPAAQAPAAIPRTGTGLDVDTELTLPFVVLTAGLLLVVGLAGYRQRRRA